MAINKTHEDFFWRKGVLESCFAQSIRKQNYESLTSISNSFHWWLFIRSQDGPIVLAVKYHCCIHTVCSYVAVFSASSRSILTACSVSNLGVGMAWDQETQSFVGFHRIQPAARRAPPPLYRSPCVFYTISLFACTTEICFEYVLSSTFFKHYIIFYRNLDDEKRNFHPYAILLFLTALFFSFSILASIIMFRNLNVVVTHSRIMINYHNRRINSANTVTNHLVVSVPLIPSISSFSLYTAFVDVQGIYDFD
jgi:hypothetical protein